MEKFICIHGHFYQPPRENPWLEKIELQDSAYPYHDWNQRITAECYEPNTAARILGPDLNIIDIINNYSKISFNFGPTLLYNMSVDNPEVYEQILKADRLSIERFSGHGSALAQVYNHMIMPLANARDKRTQAYWGIKDFRSRFKREPEGMWLPETAVDTETLEVLAGLGIKFTVLAPRQAKRVKKITKGSRWKELTGEAIDPNMPYLCQLPSGRSIALFFYNGEISQELGFGHLLDNGENFANRLAGAFPQDNRSSALVHIATDGESYGHHHKHGDMALSYCIHQIESQQAARLTNYGEYLEKFPPDQLVEIHDNSSWSCVHGVERWRSDCGCSTGGYPGWNQKWRGPLRAALDQLRETLAALFEREGGKYLKDPWAAREEYIDVINDRSQENVERFLSGHAHKELSKDEKVQALKLLGMQRNAQLMYTSCGWFFDEVSGIETVQVMQYASRAIQLAQETSGASLEPDFEAALEAAPSNLHSNAAAVYDMYAKPARVDLLRVGAHHAITSLFEDAGGKSEIYSFETESEVFDKIEAGKRKLAIGKTRISSKITWQEAAVSTAVLHMGDVSLNCGIRYFMDDEEFRAAASELKAAFEKGDFPEVIRLMDKRYGTASYTLWHLFKDEQRRILNQVLELTYKDIEAFHRNVFDSNYGVTDFLGKLGIPLPKPLGVSAEFIINHDLKALFNGGEPEMGHMAQLVKVSKHLSVQLDPETIGFVAGSWINGRMEEIEKDPSRLESLTRLRDIIKLLRETPVKLNLWKAQNIYFALGRTVYREAKDNAKTGDERAARWAAVFEDLGNYFHVRVS
jgi:alpha-amylase/alpha-mannosidase (GH57 family)